MTANTYLSKKGIKELKKHITRLERNQQAVRRMLKDLDKGDKREDRLARIEKLASLESIEAELTEKRNLQANVKQLPRKRDRLKVAVGSVVDLIDTSGRIVRYTLVDTIEANPSDGRLSIKSPLGKNLVGKQIQDFVEWSGKLNSNRLQLVSIL